MNIEAKFKLPSHSFGPFQDILATYYRVIVYQDGTPVKIGSKPVLINPNSRQPQNDPVDDEQQTAWTKAPNITTQNLKTNFGRELMRKVHNGYYTADRIVNDVSNGHKWKYVEWCCR